MTTDPILPTDDEARALARRLFAQARHGALGVLRGGAPHVSRIALAPSNGTYLALISDLASHTAALRENAAASLLIGEPGKGDPLAHPRLTIAVSAAFTDKGDTAAEYLVHQPKAQLYIGFADFHLVRLTPLSADLNGGFGKAYRLTPEDLAA